MNSGFRIVDNDCVGLYVLVRSYASISIVKISSPWNNTRVYVLNPKDYGLNLITDARSMVSNNILLQKNRSKNIDIANRELKIGDYVLVFRQSMNNAVYGIVTGLDTVYTEEGNVLNRALCFKLEHPSIDEIAYYNVIKNKYLNYQKSIKNHIKTNYVIGDFLVNKSQNSIYLYLGKKSIRTYAAYSGILEETICYSYLKFNLSRPTDKYLYECLLTGIYKPYDKAKPLELSVSNLRECIGNHMYFNRWWGSVPHTGITGYDKKKSFTMCVGHVDLDSEISKCESYLLGKAFSPSVTYYNKETDVVDLTQLPYKYYLAIIKDID